MKRVLIITYYWPPGGGGGVMRWLKMSKYLPEFGWQPVIFTPENPDPSVLDESLEKEVPPEAEIIRIPIWEPYNLYRRITGKSKTTRFKAGYISEASRGNRKDQLAVFLRGNFLIPDPRIFWVKPSFRYLKKYLKEKPVDLIISTGPPHSMHLIALKLKKCFSIPWLADFRDPWTGIDFYQRLKLTRLADLKHHSLEKKVLATADFVTVVSPDMKHTIEAIAGREVHVVYNGFDPEDFDFQNKPDSETFTVSHFGAFNRDRNPSAFWKALGMLTKMNPRFKKKLKIRLIGQTDQSVLQEIEEQGLADNLQVIPPMEHHDGLRLLGNSAVLLLPLNDSPNAKGILPGKMFEYMALRRPILAIGPVDGDCASVIRRTQSGFIHDFGDINGMVNTMELIFSKWESGEPAVAQENIEMFSRRNLAKEIISLPFEKEGRAFINQH